MRLIITAWSKSTFIKVIVFGCEIQKRCRTCPRAKFGTFYISAVKDYSAWGPAATRALPASLFSNFLKLLMNMSASLLALVYHSWASA